MTNNNSYSAVPGLLSLAALLLLPLAPAQAQTACETYIVQPGDTLSEIARIAGIDGGHQMIYSANEDVLPSPNQVEIGQRLRIPCADGSLPPRDAAAAAAPAAAPATPAPAAIPAPTPLAAPPTAAAATLPRIRFLTGGAYAPFTDETLPEQGMFTELVKRAVEIGDPGQQYRVIFIDDWEAHLTELLPSGAFDLGFPWYLPDCGELASLSPANAIHCTEFEASDPFFETVVGYYTLKGSRFEGASSYEQLHGARICRPNGRFTFDLETAGLVPPNIAMLVAPHQAACWEALTTSFVDVVTFEALPAEADLRPLGLIDTVVELPELATVETMHVFAPKANPNGRAYLDLLNEGLRVLRGNGQWFAIISRHLAAQEARGN